MTVNPYLPIFGAWVMENSLMKISWVLLQFSSNHFEEWPEPFTGSLNQSYSQRLLSFPVPVTATGLLYPGSVTNWFDESIKLNFGQATCITGGDYRFLENSSSEFPKYLVLKIELDEFSRNRPCSCLEHIVSCGLSNCYIIGRKIQFSENVTPVSYVKLNYIKPLYCLKRYRFRYRSEYCSPDGANKRCSV